MWQEWYKDGKVYTFEMNGIYSGIKNRETVLIKDGYMPVFDRRELTYKTTQKGGTVILENDLTPPEYLTEFQKELKQYSFSKNVVHKEYVNLNPSHIPEIIQELKDYKIKNVIIDSLFRDRAQFRSLIGNVFSSFTDVNFFIRSHGDNLIKLLNDELTNYMSRYTIRNPHYTHDNGECWFNDLTFVLDKNSIYEINQRTYNPDKVETLTKIDFKLGYNTQSVEYGQEYKFIYGQYQTDDSDIISDEKKKKSSW